MHHVLCLCALIPRLVTRTRLVLVLHRYEERKSTNTGQLAASCLENSTVVVTGDPQRPLPGSLLREGEQPLVLFPSPDARPIGDFVRSERPIALIVPDGNWRQGGKVRSRVPGLADVPCVSLPEGPGTSYRLRAEQREGGLATLEAIARALAVLEGDDVAEAMLAVFRVMVDRTLWTRGTLTGDEVEGGIPPEAVLHDPRSGARRP
jgi:DTW domain-containing protein